MDASVPQNRAVTRLDALEPWLPAVAALLWWVVFHPGFISEDSIINLGDARSGEISVWFTAWWVYVVDALTLGTRSVALLTLIGSLGLQYAFYFFVVTVFPKTPARAMAIALIAFSPIVGASGMQVRHDVPLTAGLLIVAAVLARSWRDGPTARDQAWLVVAAPLIATRHNGVPTLVGAVILLLIVKRGRQAMALAVVAILATAITWGATRASGNASAMHPNQTVEWLLADISCVVARGVEPTAEEWSTLTRIASRADWPQPSACTGMNPVMKDRLGDTGAMMSNNGDLWRVWGSLSLRHPLAMAEAHAIRVRLFLPPMPPVQVMSFLHSTIEPNPFGLQWTFPAIAERARVIVRAWNAAGFILANSMIWLVALLIVAWSDASLRDRIAGAIVVGIALNAGLVIAAPISEGRYGLFILICGQTATLHYVLRKVLAQTGRNS